MPTAFILMRNFKSQRKLMISKSMISSALKHYTEPRGCQLGRAASGQIHISFPHAHQYGFQGISGDGQVSNSHTFSRDLAAEIQDVWPIPRKVDVMKSKIENGPNVVQLVSSANSSCDLSFGFEMTIKIPSVRKGKAES
ncbi:hypothetical protein Nepgr_022643 [Nepenthes gracilis]|uniref:Uncharacterized protein n=1 Tax=Nepenthes gracilis TaxID=150966 RepID=A0AAD3T189_NEPGR|nr:hypothetical protein Nepgr_022643 [Nepenthes gracilis]